MYDMHDEERVELEQLDAAERAGQLLTGAQRGRLADLRRAEILTTVEGMLAPPPAAPPTGMPA